MSAGNSHSGSVDETPYRRQCDTCNRKWVEDLPATASWACECPHCAQASGRKQKTVRYCARCQSPIVVSLVPITVRLLCQGCGDADSVLTDVENARIEARKAHQRIQDLAESLAKVRDELSNERITADARFKERVGIDTHALRNHNQAQSEQIEKLAAQLDTQASDNLARAVKAKMMAKYGVENHVAMEGMLLWYCNQDMDFLKRRSVKDLIACWLGSLEVQ